MSDVYVYDHVRCVKRVFLTCSTLEKVLPIIKITTTWKSLRDSVLNSTPKAMQTSARFMGDYLSPPIFDIFVDMFLIFKLGVGDMLTNLIVVMTS